MSEPTFLLALALLLAVPGPTNMVLAVAGAQRGFRRGLPLVLAVVAGYLLTVSTLLLLAAPFLQAHPPVGRLVSILAAGWVLVLALRLWRRDGRGEAPADLGFAALFTTTLLNPKGLVIGLSLLPPAAAGEGLAASLAGLAGVVVAVSLLWLGFGAIAMRVLHRRHPLLMARGAAGSLLFFAAGMAGRAVGWM